MPTRWTVLAPVIACLLALPCAQGRPPSDSDWNHTYFIGNRAGEFVHWRDGRETITLVTQWAGGPAIGTVLALPCRPTQLAFEWQEHIPVFAGTLPLSALHDRLEGICGWACMTQLYPLALGIFAPSLGRAQTPPATSPRAEKDGLRCSIVAPRSAHELGESIQAAGIWLAAGELERLAKYAVAGHCFALIAIASEEDYGHAVDPQNFVVSRSDQRAVCLRLTFPAARPVLPAHSVESPGYGAVDNACLPGNWQAAPGRQSVTVRHFWGGLDSQRTAPGKQAAYTRVLHSDPPEELWLDRSREPLPTESPLMLLDRWPGFLAATALWVAIISYVSGGVAGLIAARRWRGYARLGLWNLTTLAGMAVAANRTPTLQKLARRSTRKVYLLSFTVAFLLMNLAADWMLRLGMGYYWPSSETAWWPWYGIGG